LGEAAKRGVGTGIGQVPDMSAFPSQLGDDSGWWKLPNGLIEQYMTIKLTKENMGSAGILYQERNKYVTFPVPFSKKCLGVSITKTDIAGVFIETAWVGIPTNENVTVFTGTYIIPDTGMKIPDQDLFVYLRAWGY